MSRTRHSERPDKIALRTCGTEVSMTMFNLPFTWYQFGGFVRTGRGFTGDESRTLDVHGDPVCSTTARYTNYEKGIDISFTPDDFKSRELYHPLAFPPGWKQARLSIANALLTSAKALKADPASRTPAFVSEREVLGKLLGGLIRDGKVSPDDLERLDREGRRRARVKVQLSLAIHIGSVWGDLLDGTEIVDATNMR